jgi:hypothetical protein
MKNDVVRDAYLAGEDATVIEQPTTPLLRKIMVHAWRELDEAPEVLSRIQPSDAPLFALAALDANIDLGRCEVAKKAALDLSLIGDPRLASRKHRIASSCKAKAPELTQPSESTSLEHEKEAHQ